MSLSSFRPTLPELSFHRLTPILVALLLGWAPQVVQAQLPTRYRIGIVDGASGMNPGVAVDTRSATSLPTNVQDFGADPLGLVDSWPAIQAAVNSIGTGGGKIFFPAGIYLVGATVTIPTDRFIALEGVGEFWNTNNTEGGSVLQRVATFTTGPLFTQVTGGTAHSAFGVQMRHLCFDGNNVAGDLVTLTQVQGFRLSYLTFANSNGNGLVVTSCFNFFIEYPRFFEIGNTTAFPNGTSALVFLSNANGGSVDGWITQPHWEAGRGSYLTTHDPTGGNPVDGLTFLGGKMEWSGNQAAGFSNPVGIGMPFAVIEGTNHIVKGMLSVNGFSTAATHWLLQNQARVQLDVQCVTSTVTDAQNPRFFVDLFSGPSPCGTTVKGTFRNGASTGSGTGAQIRVVESSITGYTISPECVFINPLSGIAVSYTNPTTGKTSQLRMSGAVLDKTFTVSPAIATQPCNAADGNNQEFVIASNIAVVVQAPTNTPSAGQSECLTITFFNSSGGALTTAPTFATGAGGFILSAAAVNPGNNLGVTYCFQWSPNAIGGARFREVSRTIAF